MDMESRKTNKNVLNSHAREFKTCIIKINTVYKRKAKKEKIQKQTLI
jgi:hypothetical protein